MTKLKVVPLFTSPRLNFYPLSENFLEEFCALDMDSEVMKYYTSRPHGTREDALKSFKRYQDYMNIYPKLGGFMAFHQETKQFIGLAVIIHLELNPKNDRYEVGYRLPKNVWGQGYATEICKAFLEYGFHHLSLTEIFGTTNPKNLVSEKVLLKCGFVKIGTTTHYGGSNIFKLEKESYEEN